MAQHSQRGGLLADHTLHAPDDGWLGVVEDGDAHDVHRSADASRLQMLECL